MKVRTIRKHQNSHGDSFVKNIRKQYDVDDREAQRLIGLGYVEEVGAEPEPETDGS